MIIKLSLGLYILEFSKHLLTTNITNDTCIFDSTNCTNCATIKLDKSHRLLLLLLLFDEMLI